MSVVETERLSVRWLQPSDAAFVFELMNDLSWLRYIGDRGITTLQDAEDYIRQSPMEMYRCHGYGLNLLQLKDGGEPIGLCGILKRDSLEFPDIGFALLPRYCGRGYAYEAAAAIMSHAGSVLGLRRILAITSLDNERSGRLLEKLGFRSGNTVSLDDDDEDLKLYEAQI